MMEHVSVRSLNRRQLLASGTAFGAALVVGPGFVAHTGEAWAAEVSALKPSTMATLIQVARDIYPHDRLADRYYATAMKAHDNVDQAPMIEKWVTYLNQLAMTAGSARYAETPREQDRVALLRKIEGSEFFKTVQGGMVVGLYNNPEVWPLLGFEGESFSKGGYINRGFDDIDWL